MAGPPSSTRAKVATPSAREMRSCRRPVSSTARSPARRTSRCWKSSLQPTLPRVSSRLRRAAPRPPNRQQHRSIGVGGIEPIEPAQQRRPFEETVTRRLTLLRTRLELRIGIALVVKDDLGTRQRITGGVHDVTGGHFERPAARENVDLDLAGLFQPVDEVEGLRNR